MRPTHSYLIIEGNLFYLKITDCRMLITRYLPSQDNLQDNLQDTFTATSKLGFDQTTGQHSLAKRTHEI